MTMRTSRAVILLVAGAGWGAVGLFWLGACSRPDVPADRGESAAISSAPPATANESAAPAPPKLVLQDSEYDFGTMETDGTGRHEFFLANHGDQPLLLGSGRSSCGCCTCVCELMLPERGEIPPRESARVTLAWTIQRFTGDYQQSETLTTNDPQQPELTLRVTGRITPVLRVWPAQLVFTHVPAGQPVVGEVCVYGYRDQPLEILGHEFTDPAQAECFGVVCQELSPDRIAAEPLARSGFRVRITVAPRLATGPFQQWIVLKTNFGSAATVEIPVQGTVGSELAVSGFGWDEQTGMLTLGTVAAAKGTTRKLYVLARGPHAAKVQLRPTQIIPAQLEVQVGPNKPLGEGAVVQIPLTVRIPPDSPPANHLGAKASELGQLILETNHPTQPQLRLLVRFAIKP